MDQVTGEGEAATRGQPCRQLRKHDRARGVALLDRQILVPAIGDAVRKLDPRILAHNPVMAVVAVVAVLATVLFVRDAMRRARRRPWLLRPDHLLALDHPAVRQFCRGGGGRSRQGAGGDPAPHPHRDHGEAARNAGSGPMAAVPALELKPGDIVLVEAGDLIPSDGEVVDGVASVNEAAITGESAPVIRESGGDRSAVTGGTLVISDRIKVRITAAPGSTFLDRMIALVEGAARQKTPNEIALNILLAGMTSSSSSPLPRSPASPPMPAAPCR